MYYDLELRLFQMVIVGKNQRITVIKLNIRKNLKCNLDNLNLSLFLDELRHFFLIDLTF